MFQSIVATSERAADSTHVAAATWLKPVKRFFRGKGDMMTAFEQIEHAYRAADNQALRSIMAALKEAPPPFWTAQHQKTLQLVLLIQYLLATNPAARRAAHFRLQLTYDPSHELTRRIQALLAEQI